MYKSDTGERLLPASQMNEKIYLIVRSITNRNVKQPYFLKKYDIIKLGRVKFKIRDIFLKKDYKAREAKKQRMRVREEQWRKKEIAKAKAMRERANLFSSSPMKPIVRTDQEKKVLTCNKSNASPRNSDVEEENDLFMHSKPTYFDMLEEIAFDSEEEQAVGENNYIEIDAMPLNRDNRPNPVVEQEEEKKEPEQKKQKKRVRSHSIGLLNTKEDKVLKDPSLL